MAKNCPYRKSRRDEEARGRQGPAMSVVTSEDQDQLKIEKLGDGGEVALQTRTSTVYTVTVDVLDSQLGPIVFT